MAFEDDGKLIFPTRDGILGTAEENRMIRHVGGPNGIRKTVVPELNGDEKMLVTRSGMPEITVKKKVTSPGINRTFVFSHIGDTIGIVANRYGGGLKVLINNLVIGPCSYAVGVLRTGTQGFWKDVLRLDTTTLKNNGVTPPTTLVTTTTPSYDRYVVPYVATDGAYHPEATGDSTRSTVFFGKCAPSGQGVSSVSTTGTEKSFLTATGSYDDTGSAGVRSTDDTFHFYMAQPDTDGDNIFGVAWSWSKIQATLASPYLSQIGSGSGSHYMLWSYPYLASQQYCVVFTGSLSRGSSSGAATIQFPGTAYKTKGTATMAAAPVSGYNTTTVWSQIASTIEAVFVETAQPYPDFPYIQGSSSNDTATTSQTTTPSTVTGYTGSSIPLTLNSSLDITYAADRRIETRARHVYQNTIPASPVGSSSQVNATSTVTVTLDSAIGKLYDSTTAVIENFNVLNQQVRVASPELSPSSNYEETNWFASEAAASAYVDSINNAPAVWDNRIPNYAISVLSGNHGTSSTTFECTTRDFVFADVDDGVTLALESKLNYVVVNNYVNGVNTPTVTKKLLVEYVLSVRGNRYTFEVFNEDLDDEPGLLMGSVYEGDAGLNLGGGTYHKVYRPPPILAPPFMSQGNCPYIAYTTRVEELQGAVPQMYVDFTLKVVQPSAWTGMDNYGGMVTFIPFQFQNVYQRYIGSAPYYTGPGPATRNVALWDRLFSTPFKVQYANGVKGVWQSQLGAGFTGYPGMEITRI